MTKRKIGCGCLMSASFSLAAVLGLPLHADVVLFDASSSTNGVVTSTNGAKISIEDRYLKIESDASETNSGFCVSGRWDISGCGRIEVELEDCGNEKYAIILFNAGCEAEGAGSKAYSLWSDGDGHSTLCADWLFRTSTTSLGAIAERLKPARTWAFAYASGIPSDAFPSHGKKPCGEGLLDRADICKVGVYLQNPSGPRVWRVERIVARRGNCFPLSKPCGWTSLKETDFFPFIDKYGQFKHKDWPDKVHSEADLFAQREKEALDLSAHPGPTGWDKWGGWADGPQLEPKGAFYTTKHCGKWWIVDPDGHLWWSHGPVRVTPSSGITPLATPDGDRRNWFADLPSKDDPVWGMFYETRDELLWPHHLSRGIDQVFDFSAANIRRKYGENWFKAWADLAHRRLRSWGCNTIANSSDKRICLMDRTPYTERYEIHSRPLEGHKGNWWAFCDPFDPSFRAEARRMTEVYREEFEDPWCIGFFVDNEHDWGAPHTLAVSALKSPADQPCKKVFCDRMKDKYGDVSGLNEKWGTSYADWTAFMSEMSGQCKIDGARLDLEKFSMEIAETYYRIIREELKRANAGKLYLGCRWAGPPSSFTVKAAARYCDVLSYNIYREDVADFSLPDGIDAPVLVGEFHFGALDRGPFCPGLILLRDQSQRAEVYRKYVRSALAHPQIVGAHWHQFSDQATSGRFDGENMQVGWTDICDTPYWETIAAVREIGSNMYELRYSREVK